MFYYAPLESYRSRYTEQLSKAKIGWMERNWREAGIPYVRLRDPLHEADSSQINLGQVLDAGRRASQSFCQTLDLIRLIENGVITNDDVIYLEDFWHPGFEQIPYALSLKGIKPKIYAFLWAQSCDCYDFTARYMDGWIRFFERGITKCLTGIFVATPLLKDIVCNQNVGSGSIAPLDKVHVVGLPFDSREVLFRMNSYYVESLRDERFWKRTDQVVFSSRWDSEKDPMFFLEVAARVKRKQPNVQFIVCTGHDKIKSNDLTLLDELNESIERGEVELREGLSKEQYYEILCASKIQFNCAYQDWVSFTLLEASVAGCFPIYPNFRSFPETFLNKREYMYEHRDVDAAVRAIFEVLNADKSEDLWSPETIKNRSWIHRRFDFTWLRMARVMGLPISPHIYYADGHNVDPFYGEWK